MLRNLFVKLWAALVVLALLKFETERLLSPNTGPNEKQDTIALAIFVAVYAAVASVIFWRHRRIRGRV